MILNSLASYSPHMGIEHLETNSVSNITYASRTSRNDNRYGSRKIYSSEQTSKRKPQPERSSCSSYFARYPSEILLSCPFFPHFSSSTLKCQRWRWVGEKSLIYLRPMAWAAKRSELLRRLIFSVSPQTASTHSLAISDSFRFASRNFWCVYSLMWKCWGVR